VNEPEQPGFPYDSTLPLLVAFVGALIFLGLIGVFMGGGTDDPGAGRVAATVTATNEIPATTPQTTATVPLVHVSLTASVAGDGHGTIDIGGRSHDCSSADCTVSVVQGATVTLVAHSAKGSTFVGWTGACGNASRCSLAMNASRSATALFTLSTPATPPSSATSDCKDGIDDDGDGLVDDADPDCLDGDSEFPAAPVAPPPAVTTTVPPTATVPPATTMPQTSTVAPPPPPVVVPPPPAQ
jgi:hypothetical protein